MKSLTAKPRSPALAAFVKSLHYHETDFPFALERIVPNGQAHLMVNLAEDKFKTYDRTRTESIDRHSGAVLAGPHADITPSGYKPDSPQRTNHIPIAVP